MRTYDETLTFVGSVGRADAGTRRVAPPSRRFGRSAVDRCHASWRTQAPSARAKRADMSRAAFLVLLTGWIVAVAVILAVSLALRWLG